MNTEKRLKLIMIAPEKEVTPIYIEDFQDLEEYEDHYHYIQRYLHKMCGNRKLRKEGHKLPYLDLLATFRKYNYCIFLDTTNYDNYHAKKIHEGILCLPNELSSFQKDILQQLYPMLANYKQPIKTVYAYNEFIENEKEQIINNEFYGVKDYIELLGAFQKGKVNDSSTTKSYF